MVEVLNKEKVLEHAKKLVDEGKIDRAISEYRRLLDLDPKDMRLKLRVAELLVKQKKVQDAVRMYKEVAESYTGDGFYLKAVTVYKNVLRLNPSLIDINFKLAELYEKMGLGRDAIHQYQILAHALEQKNDYNSLVDVRKKIVALDPRNAANRIRLAETYQYQGMEEESINEYEELVGDVKRSGNVHQLTELYEKILSYRPENLEMVRSLSELYYKEREWKKVITALEKAKELVKGDTQLLMMQGSVYGKLNQIETAKDKFRAAAEIYTAAGAIEAALEAYKEILILSPDEEDRVREWVSVIDPDYFPRLTREAEEERKKREEEKTEEPEGEKVKEKSDTAPQDVFEKKEELSFSADKKEEGLREAAAAYELGKAYHQMGLQDEARVELTKSATLYKALERSGFRDDLGSRRLREIEIMIGFKSETVVAPPPKPVVEEETIERPYQKVMVPAAPKTVAPPSKIQKEAEPKKVEKKKRDKRMGFV